MSASVASAAADATADAFSTRCSVDRACTPLLPPTPHPHPHRPCLSVDAFDYTAPATFQAATVGLFVASGLGLAVALSYLLGDATWSVSTGTISLPLTLEPARVSDHLLHCARTLQVSAPA